MTFEVWLSEQPVLFTIIMLIIIVSSVWISNWLDVGKAKRLLKEKECWGLKQHKKIGVK